MAKKKKGSKQKHKKMTSGELYTLATGFILSFLAMYLVAHYIVT